MRLFIAEKPSMGKAIAGCLPGQAAMKKGYIEVGSDVVTWCVGHILELQPPEAYKPEWKSWRLDALPMIPERWTMQPISDMKDQLAIIKKLLKDARSIVHAGDPGREGQMIVDEVLEFLNNKKPVMRLSLNATDPKTIKKQLGKLEDNKKYQPLYESAKCRSESDWLVGMNLSRAATKSIADHETLVSIGRVQTPTLALVVNRCKIIETFVPRTFYQIQAMVKTQGGHELVLEYAPSKEEQRIWEQDKAEEMAKAMEGFVGPLQIKTERKQVAPPKLYTLATLQGDGSKICKWSAASTLALAQELYVAGCLSYPRTECHFLPEEQLGDIPAVLQAVGKAGITRLDEILGGLSDPQPRKNVFSNKGMEGEEHHAIIPTGKPLPDSMSDKAKTLYQMVASRYMLSLYPNYEHDETQIVLKTDTVPLGTKGSIPRVMGWRAFSGDSVKTVSLPPVKDGEKGRVLKTRLKPGQTTPPDYYTEGTLLADMNGIGKYVSDDRIKAILSETSGIGTAATQANIIETLKRRSYMYVDSKGLLKDTEGGRKLIETLPKNLINPDMTAKWEIDLKQIANGSSSRENFMQGVQSFVSNGVKWFKAREGQALITGGNKLPEGVVGAKKPRTTKKAGSKTGGRAAGSRSRKPSA